MPKISTPLLLFFLLAPLMSVQAQEPTQTIRGQILDKDSRSPLPGATVQVLKSNPLIAAVTDENGRFRLNNIPLGRHALKVTYLGYQELFLNDIIVNSGKEVVLNLEMQESVISTKEVIVKGDANKSGTNNELISVSGRSFSIDQTQRYAGSLGDPSRMASSFAGVSGGGSDQRNDIVIRGNSPLGLLWRFEGADIPNPNHFSSQGANGGPVSILNNNVLSNSDFITGAFPSEYGNASSGVFDLKMRSGNNEKHEYTGQIGFAGVEAMAEGPINRKKASSYLINYRYSTLAFFNTLGIQFGESGVPSYQDLSFKFSFPQTKLGAISLFGIGGNSSTKIQDSEKDASDLKEIAYPQDIDFASRMGVVGLSHLVMLNKSSYIKTVFSVSGEGNRARVDSLNYFDTYRPFLIVGRNTSTVKKSVHSFYNKKFNARHTLKIGGIATAIQLNMIDSAYDTDISRYRSNYDIEENTALLQGYVNWNYRINDKLTLNTGLHYSHFTLNNSDAIEPRAGVKWAFKPGQSLSMGYGLHGQIQPLPVYFQRTFNSSTNTYTQTNRDLKMTRSQHLVLGYERLLSENLRLKAEGYYQWLNNIPVEQRSSYFSVANFGADFGFPDVDSLVSKGKGYNYGMELTLERFFNDGYYFLITASLFNSKYKASDGVWRNTAFNGNYVFNALAGKEFRFKDGKQILAISIKVTDAGGRRYIPIDIPKSIQTGQTEYDEDHAYRDRYKDYFRFDFRISFKKNGKRITQEWALDVQNALNIQNILTQQYNPRTGKVESEYQIGIFPVPLYRIYF